MNRTSLLTLALIAGSLVACARADVSVSPGNFYGAYTPRVLNYSAARGGMLVEVVGNPFDVPKGELEEAITGAMTGSHFGPHVDFMTQPPADFTSAYRIVLVFDSARGYTESKLCRSSGSIRPEGGGPVRVHAALCADGSPLSGLSGRVADVDGPDDPSFKRLISQITINLLPPFNPDRRDDESLLI